ncbi:hypothetical protein IH979_03035 [Patescibacteria group bacterium]|nr:hypothetical protein [Patescibacteria group bacterium]
MTKSGFHILRVGLAITFLWVGVLILRDPLFWSGFVHPFFLDLIPLDAIKIMYATAAFDILVGVLLLLDVYLYWVALFASMHLFTILIVAGINDITVRDIALLGGTLALFADRMPESWRRWLRMARQQKKA